MLCYSIPRPPVQHSELGKMRPKNIKITEQIDHAEKKVLCAALRLASAPGDGVPLRRAVSRKC